MTKSDNYDRAANISIIKTNAKGCYILRYKNKGEEFELFATKSEILEELSEHLDNMKD